MTKSSTMVALHKQTDQPGQAHRRADASLFCVARLKMKSNNDNENKNTQAKKRKNKGEKSGRTTIRKPPCQKTRGVKAQAKES